MGIFGYQNASAAARGNGRRNGNGNDEEFVPAKVWLNIGYMKNGKFVNLPRGLAIDTMKTEDVRGQNEDWIKLQTARNDFLKALILLGNELAPGQDMDLPNLVIKLRRVNEELDVAEDNEYAVDLTALLAGPVANQQPAE